ncbi:hypothetical protein D5b_00296 [Faustovirus]|nr:hypothetical protein D5b_00296 [Faustovirus]AMN84616.1 hypothetical protein D6_00213 [Faustovirus]AMP44244.1 hypothetical protein PRJ_Dakar_00289 [Faustovirus]
MNPFNSQTPRDYGIGGVMPCIARVLAIVCILGANVAFAVLSIKALRTMATAKPGDQPTTRTEAAYVGVMVIYCVLAVTTIIIAAVCVVAIVRMVLGVISDIKWRKRHHYVQV